MLIGYLFLAIALACGLTKGFCGKKTSGLIRSAADSVTLNFIRMGFCIVIGFAFAVLTGGIGSLAVPPAVLWVAALSGLTSSAFMICWMLSVRTGAYMMVDVFLTAGVMIPVIFCHFLYGEPLTLKHFAGFALLLVAVLIMCSYNRSVSKKFTLGSLLLVILTGAVSGITDLTQKIFVHNFPEVTAAAFNFYVYIFAGIFLGVFLLILRFRRDRNSPAEKLDLRRAVVYIIVMALCLFFNSFMKTEAAKLLPSVLIYPLSQTGGMVLSTVMSAVAFKEKITGKCIIGICVALAALMIINVF